MTEYEIRAGEYSAVITTRAAALRSLRHGQRDLVVPFSVGGPIPDYRGIIAAPWPNRIADGRYTFDGTEYEVPVNEPERDCALHGFTPALDWQVDSQTESAVELSCAIGPALGYPFAVRLTACYRLADDGLCTTVTAANTGERAAPYGVCPHPYLLAGAAPLDEWLLELPAESFLDVTADRLLPVRKRRVAGHEFDFRTPRPIGPTELDHAFTDIAYDEDGHARVIIRDPSGSGVGMSWDRKSPWVQVHTADKPAPMPNRLGLAVEPMTCPPDAFNSGQDLVRLESGASHRASWRIFSA